MNAPAVAAWLCLGLALLPLVLIVANLLILKPLAPGTSTRRLSVLIPARNEAMNLDAAIRSVLASEHEHFECLVLDDDSTDETATIVRSWASRDRRIRLVAGAGHDPTLWGKPQACAALAGAANGDYLVFMDADVRLAPDGLGRLAAALDRSGAAMLSGIPRQEMHGFAERLVVPLIHFVLLGFLPLAAMRASALPGFGVACGQLVAVRRDAYFDAGGHRRIADRIHDGMALARRMRAAGHMTDLADFGDLARCRMYRTTRALIAGFAKNAHEGLGSPRGIVPWSVLLVGGQVAWLVLLVAVPSAPLLPVALAGLAAYLGRSLVDLRFGHPAAGALLHPAGVLALVAIQWYAALRRIAGHPVAWKARVPTKRNEAMRRFDTVEADRSVAVDRPLAARGPRASPQRPQEEARR